MMSDTPTPDRRVRKTKDALGRALMGLLRKTPWDEITILMICDRADVARSSFYAHYDGKIDLLDDVIVQEMAVAVVAMQAAPVGDDLQSLNWLIDHILADRGFFNRMAVSASGQVVFSRFRLAVRQILLGELAGREPPVPADMATYIIGGSFEVILRWTLTGEGGADFDMRRKIQGLAAQLMIVT
jgi:AcrR family transcriptional regulator